MSEQDKREQAEFLAWWKGEIEPTVIDGAPHVKRLCATAWSNGAFKQRERDRANMKPETRIKAESMALSSGDDQTIDDIVEGLRGYGPLQHHSADHLACMMLRHLLKHDDCSLTPLAEVHDRFAHLDRVFEMVSDPDGTESSDPFHAAVRDMWRAIKASLNQGDIRRDQAKDERNTPSTLTPAAEWSKTLPDGLEHVLDADCERERATHEIRDGREERRRETGR